MSNSTRLERMMKPQSIAIVGASETGVRARNAIEAMTRAGRSLHLINRRGETVLGQPTHRSLTSLSGTGVIVDAAMIFTNGAAAIDITAEAAALGVGGVVVNAGGFAEAGTEGQALQEQLIAAAASMPVIGPNCNGIIAPALGLHLAGSPPGLAVREGRIAFVTHSGASMLPMATAGAERKIGFSYLVSTGNEAVVDMAEVIAFLATDESTAAICLLVETVRNPAAFWTAIAAAIAAGKPVLALKNGRSKRGQALARSHTGAVAGEAWAYAAALRQHGVILADDLVELADRAVIFDQVPRSRWTAARGLAILSVSGGWVTMASDICAEEGVDLPEFAELRAAINQSVPEASIVNPLDLTGAAMVDPLVMKGALNTFAGSPAVDTILIQSSLSPALERMTRMFTAPALDLSVCSDKLFLVGSIEGGEISDSMQAYIDGDIAVTRGLRATIRAIRSMADFVRFSVAQPAPIAVAQPLPRSARVIDHPDAGRMLSFAATMALLSEAGVPVAPFAIVEANDTPNPALPFGPPFVVKLADVPHRSDIGAVRLGITRETLAEAIANLRALAGREGESSTIAIQPEYRISSELLVGVDGENDLGPMVVCGLGGVFVEVLRQVSGRLAPFDEREALRLIGDVNRNGVLDGPRGSAAWPRHDLARLLCRIGEFAVGARDWLGSLDINPLALTPDGVCAVDGLIIIKPAR